MTWPALSSDLAEESEWDEAKQKNRATTWSLDVSSNPILRSGTIKVYFSDKAQQSRMDTDIQPRLSHVLMCFSPNYITSTEYVSTFCVLNTFHLDFTPCFTMLEPLARALALLLRTRVAMTSLPTPGSSLAITLISVRTHPGPLGCQWDFVCTSYDDVEMVIAVSTSLVWY